MSIHFHVLASGSSGNACVLESEGFGVLIDFGLSARNISERMQRCGLTWNRIHAVVLTHAHSDHWQASTLTQLVRRKLPLYCHAEHADFLSRESRACDGLASAGLLRHYEEGRGLDLHPAVRCLPILLQHDGGVTCGFRFEGPSTIFGPTWSLAYAADLGSWTPGLARQFADVDLLALEFNHDVKMQLKSGRHPFLIRRVLSDNGHLSNEQAAAMVTETLKHSEPGRLKTLVQLHLSRDCNREELARTAGQQVLDRFASSANIHTTHQDHEGVTLRLGIRPRTRAPRRRSPLAPRFVQQLLPYDTLDG
jgi:ribonuclease BN (tRNA processing enzyme)